MVQLQVSGHQFHVSDRAKQYVRSRVQRLERHFDQITNVHIVISLENAQHVAEGTVHSRGNDIFAVARAQTVYAAVDALVDKLDRQVLKHKEKITSHRAHA